MSNRQPLEGDECFCTEGYMVEKGDWLICCACGFAHHQGGPLAPGFSVPALSERDSDEASARLDREWTERQFMRDALGA